MHIHTCTRSGTPMLTLPVKIRNLVYVHNPLSPRQVVVSVTKVVGSVAGVVSAMLAVMVVVMVVVRSSVVVSSTVGVVAVVVARVVVDAVVVSGGLSVVRGRQRTGTSSELSPSPSSSSPSSPSSPSSSLLSSLSSSTCPHPSALSSASLVILFGYLLRRYFLSGRQSEVCANNSAVYETMNTLIYGK